MKPRDTSGPLVQTARTLCVKRSSKGSGSGPIPLGKARFLATGFRSVVVRIDGSCVGLPVQSEVEVAKTGTSHGAHRLNLWCRECGRPSLTGDLEACDAAIRPAVNQSELPGLPPRRRDVLSRHRGTQEKRSGRCQIRMAASERARRYAPAGRACFR